VLLLTQKARPHTISLLIHTHVLCGFYVALDRAFLYVCRYQRNHSTAQYSESANFTSDMEKVYAMANSSAVLSPLCLAAQHREDNSSGAGPVPALGGDEHPPPGGWNCIMAATAIHYVKSPLFVLQSKFDHFQLGAIATLPCMVKQACVDAHTPHIDLHHAIATSPCMSQACVLDVSHPILPCGSALHCRERASRSELLNDVNTFQRSVYYCALFLAVRLCSPLQREHVTCPTREHGNAIFLQRTDNFLQSLVIFTRRDVYAA
jgi:hypothetical protein